MKRILAIAVGLDPNNNSCAVWKNIIGSSQTVPTRPYVTGLIDGLQALGLQPGIDFQIDYATCDPKGLGKFVKNTLDEANTDAMFAMSTTAVKAAMAASKKVPIVFPSISDPVDDGVVKSSAAPGKNATGIQAMRRHTADQCVTLFKVTVPSLRTIYAFHKPHYGPATRAYKNIKKEAKRVHVKFKRVLVQSHDEIEKELRKLSPNTGKNGPKNGVLVLPDDLVLSAWPKITKIAGENKMPTFFPVTDWVRDATPSALAGFGVPQQTCGKMAAAHMFKVLHGISPKTLPVKPAGGFEWAVNQKLAQQMGITIPASVLSAADRVVI
jgi:putative tryptophan/tyrosine transport system substrate-binding protein